MTEREMFEKSFQRPKNYFQLPPEEQWAIDESLGILDWNGFGLSAEDNKRYKQHYLPKRKPGTAATRKKAKYECSKELILQSILQAIRGINQQKLIVQELELPAYVQNFLKRKDLANLSHPGYPLTIHYLNNISTIVASTKPPYKYVEFKTPCPVPACFEKCLARQKTIIIKDRK